MKSLFNFALLVSILCSSVKSNAQTALEFDGVDDVVKISTAGDSSFRFKGNFTIEAWIRMETYGFWPTIASNSSASTAAYTGYWFGVNVNENAGFQLFDSTTNYNNMGGYTDVIDSQWHHLACVYKNDTMYILVDGIMERSLEIPLPPKFNSTPLSIGNDAFNDKLDGKIENLRFWKVARTVAQIIEFKDSCLTGTETNLVALYQFENASGSKINDLTGNGHFGTLTNMDTTAAWQSGLNCDFSNVLSVDEQIQKDKIIVFPNPTQGQFSIDLSETKGQYDLVISNLEGKKIMQQTGIGGKLIQLKLNQPSGYYFITINTENNTQTISLIKQ